MIKIMTQLDNELEFDANSSLLGQDELAIDMTMEFDGLMKSRGVDLTLDELNFTRAGFAFWNLQNQMSTPVVHSAPAGFGKSTMLELWCTAQSESNLWGGIVVKAKREQVIEFVESVNAKTGQLTATYLLGKDGDTSRQDYEWQRKQANSAPVLAMTHKMFETLLSHGLLPLYSEWTDSKGDSRRRTTLIIDERPLFNEVASLSPSDIEKVTDLVRSVSLNVSGKEQSYVAEVRLLASRLKEEILKPLEQGQRTVYTIQPVSPLWTIPEKLERDWSFLSSELGEDATLLGTLQEAIQNGGTCQVGGSGGNLGSSLAIGRTLWQKVTFMNTHILDGTAFGDLNYGFTQFNMIAPVTPNSAYSTTTIYNCSKHNLGKQFFKSNNEAVTKASDLARELSVKHEKLLVVVYKDLYEQFEKELAQLIAFNKVALKYFDDERASNSYSDCDAVLFLGGNRKSMTFYPEVATLIQGERAGAEAEFSKGWSYTDTATQEFFLSDQRTDRLQGIARTRNYKKATPVTVYMFSMSDELIDSIMSELEGATLKDWKLSVKLTDGEQKVTASMAFMSWLKEFAEEDAGTTVKAKVIYETVLGVGRTQWSSIKKEDEVLQLMESLNITFKGQSIVRN